MALPIAQLQGLVENPIHQALAGYEAGRQEAAQRQQLQAKQARNVEIQGALRGLFENPNVKVTDYARIITQYPELAQQLKAPLETFEKSEQEAMKNQALSVYTAVRGGNLEMGKQLLGQYSEAARNSGDEDRANLLDSLGSTLEDNPEAYKTQSGLLLSAIMGGDEFAEMMAKADERSGGADKREADLGFTKAQTAKLEADTKGMEVGTKKAIFELEALKQGNQPIPPEKKFILEKDLRGEFNKRTENSTKIEDAFRTVQSAEDSPAGDMALIFAFMKMLDPGSTVREGEFATAQNTTGIPGRIVNAYNNARTGERLNAAQKKEFTSQAKSTLDASRKRIKEVRADLSFPIDNYGLNADNVFGVVAPESIPSELSDADLEAEIARLQAGQTQ